MEERYKGIVYCYKEKIKGVVTEWRHYSSTYMTSIKGDKKGEYVLLRFKHKVMLSIWEPNSVLIPSSNSPYISRFDRPYKKYRVPRKKKPKKNTKKQRDNKRENKKYRKGKSIFGHFFNPDTCGEIIGVTKRFGPHPLIKESTRIPAGKYKVNLKEEGLYPKN